MLITKADIRIYYGMKVLKFFLFMTGFIWFCLFAIDFSIMNEIEPTKIDPMRERYIYAGLIISTLLMGFFKDWDKGHPKEYK